MRDMKIFTAAAIFIGPTAIKMLMPGAVESVRGEVVAQIDRSIDYEAVVATLSRGVEKCARFFSPELPEHVLQPAYQTGSPTPGPASTPETAPMPAPEPSPAPGPTTTPEPAPLPTPEPTPAPSIETAEYDGLPFEHSAPVAVVVSSPFGERLHPVDGEEKFHYGIDLAANEGDPIAAFADGTVGAAGWSDSYGNYVALIHPGGYVTFYAHCSELLVSAGETVTEGQEIARVGHTGIATGPHLHFEVRLDGECIDPAPFLA